MGNSGGALVDAKGRLIGINSAIMSPSRGNIGIGFAVPVNMAANIMRSLIETGSVTRGFLGVAGDSVTPDIAEQVHLPKDATGIIISSIEPDSPADKAGLKQGDVIVAVNGKVIHDQDELRLTISEMAPGTKVTLSTARDGAPRVVSVTLAQFADKPNEVLKGVEFSKLTDDVRRHYGIDQRVTGLVVSSVDDKSPYAEDLPQGSIIVEINRQPVDDVAAARQLLHPGHNLLLVYYQGYQRYLVVTVD
jgi:serine protease Do/serine protease DegQ